MFSAPALARLAKRIEKEGQIEDIDTLVVNGVTMTLDGRNREAACIMIGKKPRYKKFKGKDPLAYVMSKNADGRRHLTPGELADAIAKAAVLAEAIGATAPSQSEAAKTAGISRSSVTRAVRKTKGPEKTSWTIEELKEDEELKDLFTMISVVYGNDHTRAIRTGTVPLTRKEVRTLALLPKEKMLEIQPLLMGNHWSPEKCVKFLSQMPDEHTTLGELFNYCIAAGKDFEVEIGKFTNITKFRR